MKLNIIKATHQAWGWISRRRLEEIRETIHKNSEGNTEAIIVINKSRIQDDEATKRVSDCGSPGDKRECTTVQTDTSDQRSNVGGWLTVVTDIDRGTPHTRRSAD